MEGASRWWAASGHTQAHLISASTGNGKQAGPRGDLKDDALTLISAAAGRSGTVEITVLAED
jgi:hypothetical protein